MLNVPLIRKVQESIADIAKPFDMRHWETCICGHLRHVVTGLPVLPWKPDEISPVWGLAEAMPRLGISWDDAATLFATGACYITSREKAIDALDRLIQREEAGAASGSRFCWVVTVPPWKAPWEAAPEQKLEPELVCV